MDRISRSSGSARSDDQTGDAPAAEASGAQEGAQGVSVDLTDAEVEAWAERVRRRRQAWVDGPTEDEKHEWIRREYARRLARLQSEESGSGNGVPTGRDPYEERRLLERRYVREARLAAEGLGVLIATLPFRILAELVRTGQDWEEEALRPARRRWIPFSDDL